MKRFIVLGLGLFFCCSLLASLGFWQLYRGEAKSERVNRFEMQMNSEPKELGEQLSLVQVSEAMWTRVEVTGRYLNVQFYLDNRMKDGNAGYEVFTPFQSSGGLVVLVNRGWIASREKRGFLPDVKREVNIMNLSGLLGQEPFTGLDFMLADTDPEAMGDGKFRLQKLELKTLENLLDIELSPLILYLDGLQPGGLRANWPRPRGDSHKHYAYALQWFTMALVLAFLGTTNLWRSYKNG